jgi:hypothetical protein
MSPAGGVHPATPSSSPQAVPARVSAGRGPLTKKERYLLQTAPTSEAAPKAATQLTWLRDAFFNFKLNRGDSTAVRRTPLQR